MSRGNTPNASAFTGCRKSRGVRWSAVVLAPALFALALATSACTAATSSDAQAGETTVTVIATATTVSAPATTPASLHSRTMPGYRLVFDDEFNGSKLDPKRWTDSLPWGNTNRLEQQYYTPAALSQHDGELTITARRQRKGGKPLTSGVVTTDGRFKFAYGYAEMRAQIPAGAGLWSAFWLVVRKKGSNEEADIVEVLGADPTQGYSVLHYGTMIHKEIAISSFRGSDLSVGYHTFALDWKPGCMVWYVDDVERQRVTSGVPSTPMIIIANLAVGGPGSWSGPVTPQTPLPAHYNIDYIRVFQRK